MARGRAGPWYRTGRGWYVTHDGVQHPLGVSDPRDESAAYEAFKRFLAALEARPKAGTVAEAVPRFLEHRAARVSPGTLKWYREYLGKLVEWFGPVELTAADPEKIAAAAAAVPTWGQTHRRNFLTACGVLFRSAGHPLKFDRPPGESRGARAVIPEDVYRRAVAAATGDLKPLLVVLWNTGARPGEIRTLTCEAVDWQAGVASLTAHKTAKKTGRPRLLVFPPPALEALKGQREKYHGKGFLFRTRTNRPFQMVGLSMRFCRLSRRLGHPLFAYALRHTFATDALANGVPDTHVAALLGHGDTSMLHRHYAHLGSKVTLLKDAAARVRPA